MAKPDRQAKHQMFENLDDLASQMDFAIIGTLSACGWKHTSATPDSVWRWVKTLPSGETLMVNQSTALDLERNWL